MPPRDPTPRLDATRPRRYRADVPPKDEDDEATSEIPTSERITIEELDALMAAAVDEDGNDTRLAEATARMTPEELRTSEENLRRSIEEARASLRTRRG